MIPTVRKKLEIVRMTNKIFITIQKFERLKLVINWEMTMIITRAHNDLITHSLTASPSVQNTALPDMLKPAIDIADLQSNCIDNKRLEVFFLCSMNEVFRSWWLPKIHDSNQINYS